MLAPEVEDRQLAVWPALGALLVAGTLGGLVSTPLLSQFNGPMVVGTHGIALNAFLQIGITAALTAVALPYALRAVAGFELTIGEALSVTLGSALPGFALALLLASAPAPGLAILPLVLSFAIGVHLLRRFARPIHASKPPLAVEAELAYASASPDLPRDVDAAATRVRLLLSSLSQAAPVDVPRRVQEGLDELQEAADGLESERELDAPRRLLVAGIRQLQGELVDLAESAWRGDHRAAINRLQGVRTIENALEKLGE